MTSERWRVAGPAILFGLVAVAAVACLAGPDSVGRVVISPWFYIPALVAAALGPASVAITGGLRSGRGRIAFLGHLGLALGLAAAVLSTRMSRSGYLFLEEGGGAKDVMLNRDLRTLGALSEAVLLDSMREVRARGFRSAPLAWLRSTNSERASGVTWNRPWNASGMQLVLSRTVEPGFPHEFELTVGGEEYLLLHNQRVRLEDGRELWSHAYDAEEGRIGFVVGGETTWLSPGDAVESEGVLLSLGPVRFALRPGAVFLLKDTKSRPLVFVGFALMLFGLVPVLARRRGPA